MMVVAVSPNRSCVHVHSSCVTSSVFFGTSVMGVISRSEAKYGAANQTTNPKTSQPTSVQTERAIEAKRSSACFVSLGSLYTKNKIAYSELLKDFIASLFSCDGGMIQRVGDVNSGAQPARLICVDDSTAHNMLSTNIYQNGNKGRTAIRYRPYIQWTQSDISGWHLGKSVTLRILKGIKNLISNIPTRHSNFLGGIA